VFAEIIDPSYPRNYIVCGYSGLKFIRLAIVVASLQSYGRTGKRSVYCLLSTELGYRQ
jgi:hypothetical protein